MHIVSTVFWLPIACIYLVSLYWRDKEILFSGLMAILLGVLMSSGYLFTALGYQEFANISEMYSLEKIGDGFIFSDGVFDQIFDAELKFLEIVLIVALGNIFGVLIFAFLIKRYQSSLVFWAFIFICSIFMMSSLSTYFWAVIPLIYKIQFPWRLVAILGFVMTIFYVVSFEQIVSEWGRRLYLFMPIGLSVLVSILVAKFGVMHIDSGAAIDSYKGISQQSYQEYKDGTRPSFNAFEHHIVPIETLEKYRHLTFLELDNSLASYTLIEDKPRSLILEINSGVATNARFKRQSYYGTEIRVNGDLVRKNFAKEMIVLPLAKGKTTVSISLKRMPLEVQGYWLSFIGFVFFLVFLIFVKSSRPRQAVSDDGLLPL